MNSKLFFEQIRKIIREEVNLALKQVITESKTKQISKEMKNENKSTNTKSSITELLNETAKQIKEESDEGKTLFFNSLDAKNFGYGDTPQRMSKVSVDIDGKQIPTENLDSSVVNALTKDYSGVMKKMNELKKKKYG